MKFYGYDLNPRVICYNSSIRSKASLISILIAVAKFLNVSSPQLATDLTPHMNSDKIRLMLYVDKMSRIFIEEADKIHSFYFPFVVKVENERYTLSFEGIRITNAACSVLAAVFSELSEYAPVDKLLERYWDVASDLLIPDEESEEYSRLITYVLSFEVGYLRYDHDVTNVNELLHPENHIDFNYTSGATFKLGLPKSITHRDLIDIIDINSPCTYLDHKS